ncbi:cytochrome p450 [Holotrichia oblita]|uniref:Cytochrome p450 n=1 Tax=Holotrichia oblita TaxID=644536 RepID=A0ACB9TNP7_HOLOL|nr:cytochrome p450 [Holotrichia oblita]
MLLTILILALYVKIKRAHKYWAQRNVPSLGNTSIFGNMENPLRQKHGLRGTFSNAYNEFKKRGEIHGGLYLLTQPVYMPVDHHLVKLVLSADFEYFQGHGFKVDEQKDPLLAHLFNLDGEQWKSIRTILTPTFTSGKMRIMFNTLFECTQPLVDHISDEIVISQALNLKEILSCFTMDVIVSCVFGLQSNLFKNPDAEFRKYGKQVFAGSLRIKLYTFVKFVLPSLGKLIHVKKLSAELENFFINLIRDVISYRKHNNVERKDFIQLFMELEKKAKANGRDSLTVQQIAAQSFIFFTAGFETSSMTMTFCLHELSFNQNIQDKLRHEIKSTLTKYNGELTYEALMSMQYLDLVIRETLRKYPGISFLVRGCSKDYNVPNTTVTIEKGTKVYISTWAIHRDEEFYPDAETFIPERFTEENSKKRPGFTFLPFGEGPRICIGQRFGLMLTKTGIAMLLNRFKFHPIPDQKYNLDFEPSAVNITNKGTLKLIVEEI